MAVNKRSIQRDIQRYRRRLGKEKRLQYYLSLARLHEMAEDLKSAEEVLREASERFPELSSVKVALAHVLNELGQPKAARDLLGPVLSQDRDNLLAARRLAESYEQSGDLEKALETYRSILRFRLVGQEVKGQIERLERLVSTGKKKETPQGDSSFVGLPTISLARLYMDQGHFQEAIKVVDRILSVDPNCEECTEIRALAQSSLEKVETCKAETFFPAEQKAEREAQEKVEREAKERAERESTEREERQAREETEGLAKEKVEREAKERAERESKEREERQAREKTERLAKEKVEREAKERAEREAREEAEREARKKAEREGAIAGAVAHDLATLGRLREWLDAGSG